MSLSKDFSMRVCCVGCVNLSPPPPLLLLSLPTSPSWTSSESSGVIRCFLYGPVFSNFKHILNFISLLCEWVFVHVCINIMCVPDTCRDQERALDILELKLQIVMSHHVGAGNENLLSLQER